MQAKPSSKKTKVVRGAKRASYEQVQINEILDASFLCHVGFVVEGEARVIPTAFVRIDNAIYLHGHLRNQMMTALLDGQTVCVTVTILDGMVLARSAFHHSVNYRSVVLFAKAERVPESQKIQVLDALIEHFVPGRTPYLRPHTEQELNATMAVKLTIDEASAKIRTGPPVDADKDYELDIWAGVINLNTTIESVENCPRVSGETETPAHVHQYVEAY